jgi:glycosyltransferase involved in cell wall biosynthesis
MERVAFITHTLDSGGAATSFCLQLLCSDIKPSEHLFIHPKFNRTNGYRQVLQNMQNYEWVLPLAWIFKGAAPGIHRKLYRMLMEGWSAIHFDLWYNRILKKEGIKLVYLNSMTLYFLLPFLPRDMKRIIHIRESFDDSLESKFAIGVIKKHADVIIAIDRGVAAPFADVASKVRIVPNPVDMTSSRILRDSQKQLKSEAGIPDDSIVVALIAPVGKQKGHDFLAKVLQWRMQEVYNVTYLLAGGLETKGDTTLIDELKTFKNVKYEGFVTDVHLVYAMADVVIRCEDYLPIGRTVWEGLYAGVPVLLPTRSSDDVGVIIDYIGRYMFIYRARDSVDFLHKLKMIIDNRKTFVPFPDYDNIGTSTAAFVAALSADPSDKPTSGYAHFDKMAQ